jgi:O-succinylhomoserine sulfhydrylase
MKKETYAIRGQMERSQYGEHSAPIYLTSSYAFKDSEEMRAKFAGEEEGNIYSRYSNPNVTELIDKMCYLENAEAGWITSSGMSAIFSTFGALLKSGDHIVSCRSIFGSTHKLLTEILPKWGITSEYVPFDDLTLWEEAIQENTKIIYLETPSNPALDIIDLEAVCEIAKRKNVLVVVDNCFATPVIQNPIDFGADIIIHSATKYLEGQGRTLGGIILGSNEIINTIEGFARHTGPCISPFNAWTISKSLETLQIRMERHCESALEIAKRLESHKNVDLVKYPFLPSHGQFEIAKKQMTHGGGLVSFNIKGGIKEGKRFLDALQMLSLTANLGDTRSIATHPASTTHSKLTPEERLQVGITDGFIRISVGLENVEDIWKDIELALS